MCSSHIKCSTLIEWCKNMNKKLDLNTGTMPNKLQAIGRVIKANEDWVEVLTQTETGCSGCSASSGCGTASLSKLFSPENKAPLRLANTLNVQEGDRVLLSMDESDLIKHSFMAYGLPLLGLFLIAALGSVLFSKNDIGSIAGGFIGLGLGWWLTRTFYHPAQPQLEQIMEKDL